MPSIQRIVIDQEFAALGITITHARMSISMPRRDMKVENDIPKMSLDTETPAFELNWSRVFSEIGVKPPSELSTSFRDEAKNETMNAIAETSRDGEFLAKVENPGNRVAQLYRQKNLEVVNRNYNIKNLPQSAPEVKWSKGALNVDWSDKKFKIEWGNEYLPEVVIDPRSSVEITLRNQPSITITVEEWDDGISQYVDAQL